MASGDPKVRRAKVLNLSAPGCLGLCTTLEAGGLGERGAVRPWRTEGSQMFPPAPSHVALTPASARCLLQKQE